MSRIARFLAASALALAATLSLAQSDPKVTWSAELSAPARAGESAQILITGVMDEGSFVYSPAVDGPPIEAQITLPEQPGFTVDGDAVFPDAQIKYDKGFEQELAVWKGAVRIALPIKIAEDAPSTGSGTVDIRFQVCNDARCLDPATETLAFDYELEDGEPRDDFLAPLTSEPEQPDGYVVPTQTEPSGAAEGEAAGSDDVSTRINNAKDRGLIAYIGLAFVFGLLALATPCVWPMIPITVSFFSKQGDDAKKNLKGAIAYCLGIMVTFTLLGVIVTAIFGSAGVQTLAANPWVNLGLAALFIVLALNLFGVFEIYVPSGVVSKLESKGQKGGGLVGPILMGLAFSLTSFTCTVPFAGTVLASGATGGWFYPVVGMLAFSLAFAIPFFLLALFPQWLAKLPQSGTWLVTVKAFMGFLELAAALKFLSNVDLVYGWGLITKEAFLAIWFGIFAVAGFYLLGWLRLPADTSPKVGWVRRGVGAFTVLIAGYMIAAMQGAPLGQMTAFMPPDPYPGREDNSANAIPWVHDYNEATEIAQSESRLMFINFTGVTCTNCRVMEGEVFPSPDVREELDKFLPVELYTDRGTEEDNFNGDLRQELTGVITNPVYVIMTPDKKVVDIFQGMTDRETFKKFLRDARSKATGSTVAQR